jgi:integrase
VNGTVDRYRVATKHPETGRYDRWRIRWDLSPDPYTGKRRQGTQRGFVTRKAADAALADRIGQVNAGTYVAPSRQRLAVYLTTWLTGLRVKPTTLDNYRTAVEVHTIPRVGGIASRP